MLHGSPPPLRTHSAKVAECLVGATDERDEEDEEGDGDGGGGGGRGGSAPATPARVKGRGREEGGEREGGGITRVAVAADRLPESLWDELADHLLPLMLADETPSVRASALTAIAFVPTNKPKFQTLLDAG